MVRDRPAARARQPISKFPVASSWPTAEDQNRMAWVCHDAEHTSSSCSTRYTNSRWASHVRHKDLPLTVWTLNLSATSSEWLDLHCNVPVPSAYRGSSGAPLPDEGGLEPAGSSSQRLPEVRGHTPVHRRNHETDMGRQGLQVSSLHTRASRISEKTRWKDALCYGVPLSIWEYVHPSPIFPRDHWNMADMALFSSCAFWITDRSHGKACSRNYAPDRCQSPERIPSGIRTRAPGTMGY